MVTSEGLNLALDVLFGSVAKPGLFYVGLVDADTFSGFSTSDTMASHTGWTEITAYDEVTRALMTFGAASGNSITNPTPAEFTPSSVFNACGFFITTGSAKGGTSGYLVAMAIFDQGTRTVSTGVTEQFTIVFSDVNSSSSSSGGIL